MVMGSWRGRRCGFHPCFLLLVFALALDAGREKECNDAGASEECAVLAYQPARVGGRAKPTTGRKQVANGWTK